MEVRKFIRYTIYKYLNESAITDVWQNKEGKRIYNKIKNNIKKIKLIPTENEFVKDSKGKRHMLNGVKFNLKDVGEDYDLDIFLVNVIGKSGNYHYYDRNANRLVFFLLSQNQDQLDFESNSYLARLRFETWVDENLFIHEFIHFLDSNRYSDTYNFKMPKNDNDYYNSPEEYNSYSHEIINQVLKNKKKMIGLTFDEFLKISLKFGNQNFIKNIDETFLKKLKNRLYKLFIQLNS